jgi:hypothetical protein
MSDTFLPPVNANPYNKYKVGIHGNLGKGANADIVFIQTVLTIDELDSITLVGNIPGSETWDVRDLFQRDVDDDRVTEDIIPYFKDESKIKYFNPITLILLPTENGKRNIVRNIEYIEPTVHASGQTERVYEREGYYRLNFYRHTDPIAKLEWNDSNCFLVAIDGQHRISGLKRWKNEPGSNFRDWKIPVVILNIFKVDPKKSTANLLEIIRKTFVYINTKAERINNARKILLNDESVNSICTQEMVQFSHNNDIKPIEERDATIMPLIFYDWHGKKQSPAPASLKSVEEIELWFEHYLFGEDSSEYQKSELFLADLNPPLDGYGADRALSHKDAERIRKQFEQIVLPGLLYFLQNFRPYRTFIEESRIIEQVEVQRSDSYRHAFMKLRFGTHKVEQDQIEKVHAAFEELKNRFLELKKRMDHTIQEDIGMRGAIFAFAECKDRIGASVSSPPSNIDYSKSFTAVMNELYDSGLFKGFDLLKVKQRSILMFIIFDEAGTRSNYRLEHAKDALGALLVVLVMSKFKEKGLFGINSDIFEEIWDDFSNTLRKTYEKGLRKKIKSENQDNWTDTIPKFNAWVKNEAEKESAKKIEELSRFIKSM